MGDAEDIRTSQLMRAAESDVARLARFLGIPTHGRDHEELAEAIRDHYAQHGHCNTK